MQLSPPWFSVLHTLAVFVFLNSHIFWLFFLLISDERVNLVLLILSCPEAEMAKDYLFDYIFSEIVELLKLFVKGENLVQFQEKVLSFVYVCLHMYSNMGIYR